MLKSKHSTVKGLTLLYEWLSKKPECMHVITRTEEHAYELYELASHVIPRFDSGVYCNNMKYIIYLPNGAQLAFVKDEKE